MKATILNETVSQPSSFLNPKTQEPQNQDLCKVKFEGMEEEFNVSLNKPTIAGLIDAFGEDSVEWKDKPLTVEIEKTRVAGKLGIALYLIPDGFAKVDDDQGFAKVVKLSFEEKVSK